MIALPLRSRLSLLRLPAWARPLSGRSSNPQPLLRVLITVSRLEVTQKKSCTRLLATALHAVAALDPPPATKTTRNAAAATGHSRTLQAQVSRGRSCSRAGSLSVTVIRVKIDSIVARSGSDADRARSVRRSSLSWRYGSVIANLRSACGSGCRATQPASPPAPGDLRVIGRRSPIPPVRSYGGAAARSPCRGAVQSLRPAAQSIQMPGAGLSGAYANVGSVNVRTSVRPGGCSSKPAKSSRIAAVLRIAGSVGDASYTSWTPVIPDWSAPSVTPCDSARKLPGASRPVYRATSGPISPPTKCSTDIISRPHG